MTLNSVVGVRQAAGLSVLPTAVDLLDSLRGKPENALLFDGVRGQSEQGGERQQ